MRKKVLVPATRLEVGVDSLAQSSELVGVGRVPSCFVAGISTELAMFEEFTRG